MNMKAALYGAWEAIANEILPNEGEEGSTLRGVDLQGIVPDYAETYLYGEELAAWKAADWDQRDAWVKEAFPDKELYGF